MLPTDFESFRKMIALTAEQYGKSMSPDLIRFYFDGLAHLPLDTVRAALNKHVLNTDTGQFMPKIADIIRACDGRSEDVAYAALVELQEAIRSPGTYVSVEFADRITMAVVRDMGGWPAIGQWNEEEWLKFGSKDFLKRYRIYKDRGDANAPAYLPGLYEHSPNGTFNQRVQIGTKRKQIGEQKRIAA